LVEVVTVGLSAPRPLTAAILPFAGEA
jgi:hypothetical protein